MPVAPYSEIIKGYKVDYSYMLIIILKKEMKAYRLF